MVWVLVVILIALGLGWYVWTQGSSSTVVPTTQTDVVPPDQTQGTTTPGTTPTPTPTTTATTPSAPMTATVMYDGRTFTPATVTIASGGTVTFKDTAGATMWVAADPHPVHTDYDNTTRAEHCAAPTATTFDQCTPSATYSFTFSKVGSWGYHDHRNSVATGVVVVK